MFIHYHHLLHSHMVKVWGTLLCRVEVHNAKNLNMFATHELNNHKSHNSISIAHTYMTNYEELLIIKHILKVVKMFQKFYNNLQDVVLKE
jgi:hypothetical protein